MRTHRSDSGPSDPAPSGPGRIVVGQTASGAHAVVLTAVLALLGACGGGATGDSPITPSTSGVAGPNDGDGGGGGEGPGASVVTEVNGDVVAPGNAPAPAPEDDVADAPADIARYGVIAVGDEGGVASGDALGSFSRLSTTVSIDAFGPALSARANACTVVTDDGRPSLTLASALYLPAPDGATLESVGAGDAVLLSSSAGSWLELQGQPSDRFYTRASSTAPPTGAVPPELVANVTGDGFPAFTDAAFPTVTPLAGVAYAGDEGVASDTRFTWEPGADPEALVRIETASVASFFAADGLSVSCLAPDTGAFEFPAEVRAALGTGFTGEAPDFSRLAFETLRDGDALLVLVRESFATR